MYKIFKLGISYFKRINFFFSSITLCNAWYIVDIRKMIYVTLSLMV